MSTISTKKLPKKVYVYRTKDDDYEWLTAEESTEACAEKGESRLVGIYELKETITVTLEVKENVIVTQN